MIKRKNILAENMLRFRSKNIAAEEAAAIRKLIEQQTTEIKIYKNPTDIADFFTKTVNTAMVLAPDDVKTVIFKTRLDSANTFGAKSGKTAAIQLASGLYVAVGQIATLGDKKNPGDLKPYGIGAVLFYAGPDATQSDPKYGAYTSAGYVRPISFIPYAVNTGDPLNGLAKFASDIIKAIEPGRSRKEI
jgi:hypothetical protein